MGCNGIEITSDFGELTEKIEIKTMQNNTSSIPVIAEEKHSVTKQNSQKADNHVETTVFVNETENQVNIKRKYYYCDNSIPLKSETSDSVVEQNSHLTEQTVKENNNQQKRQQNNFSNIFNKIFKKIW